MKKHNILIVDDIESIRIAIIDFLSSEYNVFSASNGIEALEILKHYPIDMIISDIRMPDMDGITLLTNVQKLYPTTKYALITAYNINDYIQYARQYKIWNIIPKSSFLDLQFIKSMIYKLLSNDILGFEKYFQDIKKISLKISELYKHYKQDDFILPQNTIYHIFVQSEEEREKVCDMIFTLFKKKEAPNILRILLEEFSINARDYGSENYKYPIKIQFGLYDKKFLIGVNDYRGILSFDEVLYRLERNILTDKNGLPLSINDIHGRGFFIARENLDHLIINIKETEETEILGIFDSDNEFRYKAISLYKTKPTSK
jgi:CheY-like chemotaxis protein/anti-sigma regulatory factor (Ser/Thr protein kinase)